MGELHKIVPMVPLDAAIAGKRACLRAARREARATVDNVARLKPQGKVLMTLGKPGIAGAGPDTFNAPTDVLVAANGDVFVCRACPMQK